MSYSPISSEVLQSEVKGSMAILQKWLDELEAGIPGIDREGSQDVTEEFLKNFLSEMLVVSAKCESIANILHQTL